MPSRFRSSAHSTSTSAASSRASGSARSAPPHGRIDTIKGRIDTIKAQVYGIPLIRPCEPPDETCCTSVGTVRSTALRAAGGTHRPAGEHRAGGRGRTGYTPAEAGPPRGLVGGLASSGTNGGGGRGAELKAARTVTHPSWAVLALEPTRPRASRDG